MTPLKALAMAAATLAAATAFCQNRTETLLEKNWRFTRNNDARFFNPKYNDAGWEQVTVPHDWAIYGPFSIGNDRQNVAIAQDGQKEAMEHAGRTGGLPFVGCGWYRLHFDIPSFEEGKKVFLLFDGAMSHAEVFVNGYRACSWPYGYSSFYTEITPFVTSAKDNTLAVRLENQPESSRWYPGAGLYRNVHLIVTEDVHVPIWGTQITTPEVGEDFARIDIRTEIEKPEGILPSDISIETSIISPEGYTVATSKDSMSRYSADCLRQEIYVDNPELWSPETPAIYKAVSNVYCRGELKDTYETSFGIRTIEIVPDKGFLLNGKLIKFKGVCMHHDLGPLGAAVNEAAIRRQIRIMQDMGCNAIRTSHNMPAPEYVRIADETGMMLMVETFDEWKSPKCENGYHNIYDEWMEKDLTNMLRQYRNSPSVMMWCIGNEVPDQFNYDGAKLAKRMQDICHREDPTRPVTQGMDAPDAVVDNNFAAVMDIPGFNYRPFRYEKSYHKLPQRLILGTETASTVSSRGVYKFPVTRQSMKKYDDHQASSYDVEHCAWSNLPEDDFIRHEDLPYCMGEFVWTGFDYLGEPTPYYSDWPSHSSLFGIVDLAGLPKDRYYLYRSHWNRQDETLHILPHWNWEGKEGDTIPVFVYTSYPSAELFINGVSQGIQTKDTTITIAASEDSLSQQQLKRQRRYRLMWTDTRYQPGTMKVVAYGSDGKPAAEKTVTTAGKPYAIKLEADRDTIAANGKDLAFVTVSVTDKDGNPCPDAAHLVKFKVKGKGTYRAGANGDPTCTELFHLPQMHLFSGKMTAIVQATEEEGKITLEATAKGLKKARIEITAKDCGK